MPWEYLAVTENTTAMDAFATRLNLLGSVGWEVCGFAAADRTIGLNAYTALLRRERAGFPPPDDTTVAWKPDPSGRGQYRFWDGFRWSEHITTDNVRKVDWPMPHGNP